MMISKTSLSKGTCFCFKNIFLNLYSFPKHIFEDVNFKKITSLKNLKKIYLFEKYKHIKIILYILIRI